MTLLYACRTRGSNPIRKWHAIAVALEKAYAGWSDTVRQLILTLALLALLALLAPAAASAQMIHRGPGSAHPPPPQPPPLVAPPPIVLPLPSVLPPPDNGGASPFSFEASDPTRAHRDLFRVVA